MKKYIKPAFDFVKLIPEERMAFSGGAPTCTWMDRWTGSTGNRTGCTRGYYDGPGA
jgi:hypothetical protein